MSLFILCYRPHSRLVLLSHVVHLFLVCLHVVLTAVLCLPLCHFLFCVSSLLLSSSGGVDVCLFLFRPRHVSVSVLSFHLSVLSPFSVVLCCPPVVPSPPSLSRHVSSIISSLSCPLSWSVSSRVFPPVMFCLVLSCLSPVSLLSVLLPSCDCVRQTLQSGGSSSTTKHILALESKLTY